VAEAQHNPEVARAMANAITEPYRQLAKCGRAHNAQWLRYETIMVLRLEK
jgi:hypothetical protein